MSETTGPKSLSRAADRQQKEQSFSHPLNPKSEIHGVSLSESVGLTRLGVHLLRVPPGKESFVFHSHEGEEEFVYILAGRGLAEIGDEVIEVGPGDFMGFTAPSIGHHLRNPFDEDLVYLSGGERREMEVADYPRHGLRMVRIGHQVTLYRADGAMPFGPEALNKG